MIKIAIIYYKIYSDSRTKNSHSPRNQMQLESETNIVTTIGLFILTFKINKLNIAIYRMGLCIILFHDKKSKIKDTSKCSVRHLVFSTSIELKPSFVSSMNFINRRNETEKQDHDNTTNK